MPKKKMTKKLEKVEKKAAPQMNNKAAMQMSPYRMGHNDSPVENHHYGTRKGESIKQERKDLMQDMPVVKDATGGRDMSWMSKHVTKMGGSPIKSHCTK